MAGLVPFNRRKNALSSTGLDFYNMIDDFFGDDWMTGRRLAQGTFKVDVKENDKEYIVEAELPGIDKTEIDLGLEENFLTISVNKEEAANEVKENYIHRERWLSSMSRSIRLVDSKTDDIKAKLENGVLTVKVAKQDKAQASRKINIE